MSPFTQLRSWLHVSLHRSRTESDMDVELRFHMEAFADDLVRSGVSRDEALRRARIEFGGLELTKDQCRDARSATLLDSILQDLRYGFRTLRKSPGFTAVAILTLALGIGANTAIFSVVNSILLHPLAYKDADRLVTILHDGNDPVAAANYIEWRDQSSSFLAMGAAEYWSPNLTGVDAPEHLRGHKITQNLFPMLGIDPFLGRFFSPEEDQPGSEHEVILSYRLWQRRFAGDIAAIGKSILLDGAPYTIVGVMPQGFQFAPFWATHADLWVPIAFGSRVHNRGGNSLRLFARLKPGATLSQASAEMTTISARLEQLYPGTNRHVQVTPLKEKVVGKIAAPLLVLLCAVGFVLLMACANVAHMVLARAAARQKEIAVRTALGAGRVRVVRQFLTENLLLSSIGGSVGWLLAFWCTRALLAISPSSIPRVETVTLDGWVVLFLFTISLLTSVGFGLAPALHASAVNLSDTLKETGRGSSDGLQRSHLRSFLVASEFALALMLLIGAGLMIRSFFALQSVDPGFNPHNVLSMVVSVAGSNEAPVGNREVFYRQLLQRVLVLPGVESVGGINHLPLAGDTWIWPFQIEGRSKPLPGDEPGAVYRMATPGYFYAMQLPLLHGRDIFFTDDSTGPGVVVINERAARAYWPDEDPLGKRISFDTGTTNPPTWLTIIGIVKDAKQEEWALPADPEVYLSAFQDRAFLGAGDSHSAYITLVARTHGNPAALAPALKEAVWSFDRNLPISEVLTMDGVVADANAQPRFEMLLLGLFAALALVLATVGIYGVMSYSVAQRTHEIGIRVSLGASRANVVLLVVRHGLLLALTGSAAGIAGALALSRMMKSLLYEVKPTDPLVFAAVTILLVLVAVAACYIPARRATRIDPMVALRHE
jgi:predicted permease